MLVADDSDRYRQGIERTLRRHPRVDAVTAATDGDAALLAVRQFRPHVVLADHRMPGLTGLEFLRAVRVDRTLTHVRIVLTTAEPDESFAIEALKAGATAWIDKAASRSAICDALLAAVDA